MENVKHDQKGSAFVGAVIVLVLLTVLGYAALESTDLELFQNRNSRDYKEDFFISDGGLNRESVSALGYPIYPTPEEQMTMDPFRIAISSNGTYAMCPDGGNCTTTNATLGAEHTVVNNAYDYAVDFRNRRNALIKGESADLIYYRLYTRRGDASIQAEAFRRTTTGM